MEAQGQARATKTPGISPTRTSLFSQIALFSLTSFLVAVSTVLLVKLYAMRYSPGEVAAFLVFRPYGALLVAVGSFGLFSGLRRTVPMLDSAPRRQTTVAMLGFVLGTAFLGTAALAAWSASELVVVGIAADGARELWKGFLWMTLAQAMVTLALSIELGSGRTLWVSAVMLHGFALAPLLAFVAMPDSSFAQVMWVSGHVALLACAPTAFRLMREGLANGIGDLNSETKALARYSAPRMVANVLEWVAEPAVLWLALKLAGFSGGGALAVGVTLLRLLNPLSVALNQAIIPAAARLNAASDHEGERRQVFALTEWAWGMGVFASMALLVWADVLIAHWLGNSFADTAGLARVLAVAAAPSMVYLALRGVIDGQTERAVNAQNLGISLTATLAVGGALAFWLQPALGLALGYVGGRWLLAGLTLRFQVRSRRLNLGQIAWMQPLWVGSALGAALWVMRWNMRAQDELIALAAGGTIAAVLYFLVMLRLGASWAKTLQRRIGWGREVQTQPLAGQ